MRCTNCGNENTEGKFCAYCGGRMYEAAHCVKCGREIPEGHELCVDCLSKPVTKKKSSKGLVAAVIVMILTIAAIGGALLWYFLNGSFKTEEHELVKVEEEKSETEPETETQPKKEPKTKPESEPEEKPTEKELSFEKLEASSEYEIVTEKKGLKSAYYVEYLSDNNYKTTWSPERDDEKPWVEFGSEDKQTVSKIIIENGYSKTENLYYQNARAKKILIECENFSMEYVLKDMGCGVKETIELPDAVDTNFVKISVISMYEGEEREGIVYGDLCISEVDIYGF